MKETVSPRTYIDLLNRELRRHPGYREGMVFVPSPEGASGDRITGFTMLQLDEDIYADVSRKIFREYKVDF